MLHAPFNLPRRGVGTISPAGVSGVSVAANTQTPETRFRWPFRTMLWGLRFCVNTGLDADLAQLNVQIIDEDQQLITLDGQGFQSQLSGLVLAGRQLGIGGAASLHGGDFGGRQYALQRLVQAGDIWTFRIANQSAARLTPELVFFCGEVTP